MPRAKGNAKFCPYCGVSFYSAVDFKSHIRSRHQPVRPPNDVRPSRDGEDAVSPAVPPLASEV